MYDAGIKNYFTGFYLMEGGDFFSNINTLKNLPLLIMMGDIHGWGKEEDEAMVNFANNAYQSALKAGIDADLLVGKGVGHETAPVFTAKLYS